MKSVYNIPFGVPPLATFARWLLNETSEYPLRLAKYTVLLPTRRACLALSEAFLSVSQTSAVILPKILALPDLEDDPHLLNLLNLPEAPQCIPKIQLLGRVAKIIQEQDSSKVFATCMGLAEEFLTLLDEVQTTDVEPQAFHEIVQEEFAKHWEESASTIHTVFEALEEELKELNLVTPFEAHRQNLLSISKAWSANPPADPVILFGTTGTRPATAELAKTVLSLPQGRIILTGLFEEKQQSLPLTHPNFTLNDFMEVLEVGSIAGHLDPGGAMMSKFLQKVMSPENSGDWKLKGEEADFLAGHVEMVEALSAQNEAEVASLIIRSHLQEDDKTIALITPDQKLARRVQAELDKWGIIADSSAGIPLQLTPVGEFVLRTAKLLNQPTAIDFLSAMKHPMCMGADPEKRKPHLHCLKKFETEHLRGASHSFSLQWFKAKIDNDEDLRDWGQALYAVLEKYRISSSYVRALQNHIQLLKDLVGSADKLFSQDDGEELDAFFEELLSSASHYPSIKNSDYKSLLKKLMSQRSVRKVSGIGSRVKILGALEARLQESDVVIMSGLNEGAWPKHPETGPWLNRPMREAMGLPALERRIGLSAHDFCCGFSASKIYLTRSEKDDGAPTTPSRWWVRMKALRNAVGRNLSYEARWCDWASQLNKADADVKLIPPQPKPPKAFRPKQFSATGVERLMRDPYAIYAKSILKLKPLDPLEQQIGAADRGNILHKIFDLFFKNGHDPMADNAKNQFIEIGQQQFKAFEQDPIVMSFWWQRFERIVDWFLDVWSKSSIPNKIITEQYFEHEIIAGESKYTLRATVDRMDFLENGLVRIIDYKTGFVPTQKDVRMGFAPQLPFEAIAANIGEGVELEYWQITGGDPAGKIIKLKGADDLVAQTRDGVERLLVYFGEESSAYLACPDPRKAPKFNDYEHLERAQEWSLNR